jgi:predicted nucleic acid-binding Zn ribbon protein
MRRNTENNLDDDVADVQSRADRECASKTRRRMRVAHPTMMVVLLLMSLVIVVTHRAILLRLLFWRFQFGYRSGEAGAPDSQPALGAAWVVFER